MFDTIRSFFRSPPKQRGSGLGAGLSDQDDDRFPTFQNAWKQGATFEDMFGDKPFQLHGSVGGSGADNHRPDVAKVETFLGDAGFYKPMTSDGPTGWHNTNLDQGIKAFQKAHGLKVDGLLKPNGPTITRIGGLLGGGQAQPPAAKPAPKLEIANPIPAVPQSPWARPRPAAANRDPFSGHAIAPDGAEAHDRYAQALVNDSDPSKTAAFLNNVIGWEGDRGRGDVADLLGRFQKVDPEKARNLQDQLFKLTGQRVPFRIAPVQDGVGGPMADLEDPAPVRLPKANPWGGTEGANTWEAGNMAKVLLERTDYKDAVTHFAGEFKRDPDGTRPYTAAVYQAMAAKSPAQALQFIKQMADGGLARMAEEAPPEESGEETDPPETPVPDPTPPKPEPGPEDPEEQPEDKPDDKPEEGQEEQEAKGGDDKEEGKYPPPRDPDPCLGEQTDLEGAWQARDSAFVARRDKRAELESIRQRIEALQSGEIDPEDSPEAPDPPIPGPPDLEDVGRPGEKPRPRPRPHSNFAALSKRGGKGGKGGGKGDNGGGWGDIIGDVIEGGIDQVDHYRKREAARRAEIERLTAEATSLEAEIEELEVELNRAEDTIAERQEKFDACRASNPSSQ